MKKQIVLLILSFCAMLPAAASVPADTVIRFFRPDSVSVSVADNSLTVKVSGDRYGDKYQYDYQSSVDSTDNAVREINLPFTHSQGSGKNHNQFSISWGDNLYVGGTIHLNHAPGIRGGWEIGIDNVVALRWRPSRRGPSFSLGFGMGYRSANVGGGWMLAQHGKILTVDPVGGDIDRASSRLHLFRLHVPLMITQRVCKNLHIRVGGVLNLNTYMSATTKTEWGGVTSKTSFHSLHQRFITADLFGSVNFIEGMGVYARWSPMQVFDKGWGPKFEALSVGVNFIL